MALEDSISEETNLNTNYCILRSKILSIAIKDQFNIPQTWNTWKSEKKA